MALFQADNGPITGPADAAGEAGIIGTVQVAGQGSYYRALCRTAGIMGHDSGTRMIIGPQAGEAGITGPPPPGPGITGLAYPA